MLKSFIYDTQNKMEIIAFIINNLNITVHKKHFSKRLKVNVESTLPKKSKQVLKNSTQVVI
jgi:hypothetical protein